MLLAFLQRTARRSLFIVIMAVVVLTQAPFSGTVNALSLEQRKLFNDEIFYFNHEVGTSCTGGTGAAGGLDAFLQALALQESGGNPTAHSPISSASGKYQYLTGTWRSVGSTYYPPALQYSAAFTAPESMQDALVKIEYTKKSQDLGGDPFKMAISHFYPAANDNPTYLDKYIGGNTVTPRQYAESVVRKMQSGAAQHIPLLYAQAPEFQTYYQVVASGGASASGTANSGTDTSVQAFTNSGSGASGCVSGGTSGSCAGGKVVLSVPEGGAGVNVCYFSQSDDALETSDFNWPACGCEPTSTLMIRATYENNPSLSSREVLSSLREVNAVADDNCSGAFPSTWMSKYFTPRGYTVQKVLDRSEGPVTDATLTKVKELLGQGYVMMAHTENTISSNPNGTRTDGHYLLVHAVDAEGNFYVANPGASADNGKAVSPERMKTWLNEFYAVKK